MSPTSCQTAPPRTGRAAHCTHYRNLRNPQLCPMGFENARNLVPVTAATMPRPSQRTARSSVNISVIASPAESMIYVASSSTLRQLSAPLSVPRNGHRCPGQQRKRYPCKLMMTPYEKLKSMPIGEQTRHLIRIPRRLFLNRLKSAAGLTRISAFRLILGLETTLSLLQRALTDLQQRAG